MKYFRNLFCLGLIAIMPISYYANDADSSHVRIDGGVGTGQYMAIMRSCDDIRGKRLDQLTDVGADVAVRPEIKLPFVVGIRAGHLSTDLEKLIYTYYPITGSTSLDNGYINPYWSIEFEYFGIGAGWGRNLGPVVSRDLIDMDIDYRHEKDYASGHIRVGSYSSVYGIMSIYEGTPIASEYGYLLLGGGVGLRKWHLAGGCSVGPYDNGGVYLGVSRDIERYGRPSLSVRAGSAKGEFEGAISLGWSWPVY